VEKRHGVLHADLTAAVVRRGRGRSSGAGGLRRRTESLAWPKHILSQLQRECKTNHDLSSRRTYREAGNRVGFNWVLAVVKLDSREKSQTFRLIRVYWYLAPGRRRLNCSSCTRVFRERVAATAVIFATELRAVKLSTSDYPSRWLTLVASLLRLPGLHGNPEICINLSRLR